MLGLWSFRTLYHYPCCHGHFTFARQKGDFQRLFLGGRIAYMVGRRRISHCSKHLCRAVYRHVRFSIQVGNRNGCLRVDGGRNTDRIGQVYFAAHDTRQSFYDSAIFKKPLQQGHRPRILYFLAISLHIYPNDLRFVAWRIGNQANIRTSLHRRLYPWNERGLHPTWNHTFLVFDCCHLLYLWRPHICSMD